MWSACMINTISHVNAISSNLQKLAFTTCRETMMLWWLAILLHGLLIDKKKYFGVLQMTNHIYAKETKVQAHKRKYVFN